MVLQGHGAANPVLWTNSPSSDGNEPNNETKTGKPGRAPKSGRVLLRDAVPFFDVDCLCGGSRDGQRDTGADLECSVQLKMCQLTKFSDSQAKIAHHSTTQTFDLDWNCRQNCRACRNKNKRHSRDTDK
jgi:hypothetical protein